MWLCGDNDGKWAIRNEAFSTNGKSSNGKKQPLTIPNFIIDQPPILLQLYSHASRILPIPRMKLLRFMQRPKPKSPRRFCHVPAQRPPDRLFAWNAPLTSPIRAFSVDVNRVDTYPPIMSRRKVQYMMRDAIVEIAETRRTSCKA